MELKIDLSNKRTIAGIIVLICVLGLIFYLARWMEGRREAIATIENGFVPFAVILGIVVLLLVMQPDFGTTVVVTLIATAIYFAAGARVKHIALGGIIAASLAVLVVNLGSLDYVKDRFSAFLDPSIQKPLRFSYPLFSARSWMPMVDAFGRDAGRGAHRIGG